MHAARMEEVVMLRETGSIRLDATPEAVIAAVARRAALQPGVRVSTGDRVEVRGRDRLATFVVRRGPDGTQLIHARADAPGATGRRQEDVRRAVEAELDAVRRLVEGG